MRVWSRKESRAKRDRAQCPWRIAKTGVTVVGVEFGVMEAQVESTPSASR